MQQPTLRTARARFVGTMPDGTRVHRVPVRILCNDSHACKTVAEVWTEVLSANATDAANYVRDMMAHRPETEIDAIGPKGGRVSRYVGWFSAIGPALAESDYRQTTLGL